MKVILLLWSLLAFILVVKGHEGHDHVHEGKNPTVPIFISILTELFLPTTNSSNQNKLNNGILIDRSL